MLLLLRAFFVVCRMRWGCGTFEGVGHGGVVGMEEVMKMVEILSTLDEVSREMLR